MKGKKEKSEQARINAVNERIQAQLKSKQIVQKALKACLDGKSSDPNPNHIVFDSSDDEGDKKNFDDLLGFGGDDDDANDEIDNDEAFAVKSQFEGKKGLKLMKMQQKIGNNPRFQIDERFANEDDDEDEEHEDGDDEEEDGSDELKRNLSILEQVVGPKKMKAAGKRSVQFVDINQRRYDPSKSDHDKFVIKSKDSDEKPAKKKKKKTAAELPAPPVSEERFYEVQYDKLKEAFGSNEEEAEEKPAFSMASLFSMPKVDEEEDKQEDNMEVDHQQEAEGFLPHFSHFNEDSSGSEMDENYGNNDDEQVMTSSTKLPTTEVSTATITNKVDTKHDEMLKEMRRLSKTPWSLIPTKERLEEVRKFAATFPPKLSYEDRYTKWVEQKDTLREDYKKKHRDHMRAKKRHSKSQDDEQDDSLRTFI